jgi:hypothetical protein
VWRIACRLTPGVTYRLLAFAVVLANGDPNREGELGDSEALYGLKADARPPVEGEAAMGLFNAMMISARRLEFQR